MCSPVSLAAVRYVPTCNWKSSLFPVGLPVFLTPAVSPACVLLSCPRPLSGGSCLCKKEPHVDCPLVLLSHLSYCGFRQVTSLASQKAGATRRNLCTSSCAPASRLPRAAAVATGFSQASVSSVQVRTDKASSPAETWLPCGDISEPAVLGPAEKGSPCPHPLCPLLSRARRAPLPHIPAARLSCVESAFSSTLLLGESRQGDHFCLVRFHYMPDT